MHLFRHRTYLNLIQLFLCPKVPQFSSDVKRLTMHCELLKPWFDTVFLNAQNVFNLTLLYFLTLKRLSIL